MQIERLITSTIATNTYIISNNGSAIIIDPADDTKKILDYLSDNKLTPTHVFITHGHFDHVGSVPFLRQSGAKVCMHKADYDMLNNIDWVFKHSVLVRKVQRFDVDILFTSDEVLNINDMEIKIIHTPGHTLGGVCYLFDNKHLFSGDTLFCCDIGRTDLPGGNWEQLILSVKNLLKTLPDEVIIYPGHEGYSSIGFEKANNPYV